MNTPTRITTAVLAAASLGLVGLAVVPANAATAKPVKAPTSLTLKAHHSTVAPKHKDTLTGTLKSGRTRIAGATVTLEKRSAGSHKSWTVVTTKTTDANGHVTLTVTPGSHKGHKEQYELKYAGDATHKASHSSIITITVS